MVKSFQQESSNKDFREIEKLQSEIEEREKLLIKQELELTDLRISTEKQEDIIKAHQEHIKANQEHIHSLESHLNTKEETIGILRDIIYKKFGIKYIRTEDLHKEFQNPTYEKVKELIEKAENQTIAINQFRNTINQFRNSIVYPLYKITHSIGETRIGKALQKIIK